jgi:hypothetical protein
MTQHMGQKSEYRPDFTVLRGDTYVMVSKVGEKVMTKGACRWCSYLEGPAHTLQT